VVNTVMILCSEVVSLGVVSVDVPRRRRLSGATDAVADLLLHIVNRVLDDHFKWQLMQGLAVDGRHLPHRLVKEVRAFAYTGMHGHVVATLHSGAAH
jgi:hypothetical protein